MAKIAATVALTVSDADQPRAQAVSLLRQLAIALRGKQRVSMDESELIKLDMLTEKLNLTVPSKPAKSNGTGALEHASTCDFWGLGMSSKCACQASRKSPTRVGRLGVQITRDGQTVRYESMSAACRWLAANVETAESCRDYVVLVDAKRQSRNARLHIERDIDNDRLDDIEVEFDS